MENILKKDVKFQWKESYQDSLDTLKNKMTNAPILVFPEWKKQFHVHVSVSSIMLNMVLSHPGEGSINHPISFASRKLSTTEKSYTMTEREGLAMVYALQKFKHYLLGGHFKMYTIHYALKYFVKNPLLGGKICRWIILFQEFGFEIIVKHE